MAQWKIRQPAFCLHNMRSRSPSNAQISLESNVSFAQLLSCLVIHSYANLIRFSRRAITQQEPLIQGLLVRLCDKLNVYKETGKPLSLQKMFSALTCDAVAEYMFGFNYNQIDADDFSTSFHHVFLEAGTFANFGLHFPWIGRVCNFSQRKDLNACSTSLRL